MAQEESLPQTAVAFCLSYIKTIGVGSVINAFETSAISNKGTTVGACSKGVEAPTGKRGGMASICSGQFGEDTMTETLLETLPELCGPQAHQRDSKQPSRAAVSPP